MHQVAVQALVHRSRAQWPAPTGPGRCAFCPSNFCWIDVLDQVILFSWWCACVCYCGLAGVARLPLLGRDDAGELACRVSSHLAVSQSATSTVMA